MKIEVPAVFRELWRDHQFKIMYGGRGSGKSRAVATYLITTAYRTTKRILCTREIQKSLRNSVMQLLIDEMERQELTKFFRVTQTRIEAQNGSLFFFEGLRSNPDSIKSTANIDIAWVEEANNLSKRSLDLLMPTIMRNEGSQLIMTFNPNKDDDPVYEFFVKDPPPNAWVQKVNWMDNPYFPKELDQLRQWDRSHDIDRYNHIWEGTTQKTSMARVFNNWRVDEMDTGNLIPQFGADWGFSKDPSVLTKIYIIDDKTLYFADERYGLGAGPDELPALFAGTDTATPKRWANPQKLIGMPGVMQGHITADSSRPETIAHLRKKGFNIFRANKGKGSVLEGIEWMKSKNIVIHPDCKHTINEFMFYEYKTDPQTEKVLPVLRDEHNHVIDAARYALEGAMKKKLRSRPVSVYSELISITE